ncbi:MAG: peptidoglycan editing factor PgeF [Nevskia sp.]|nr:peptidoglycan editing factor PgeF [Nevskia sp.]
MSEPLAFLRPDWPAPPRVRAAVTTRGGGVSGGPYAGLNMGGSGDRPESIVENRRRVAQALRLPQEPCWLRQVHGTRVVRLPDAEALPQADAAYAQAAGAVCAVQAADCLPVLLCDEAGTMVAAAHAGWRGLAAGVLEATVAALPAAPARLLAWLGPAIGAEAFEVGAEVRARFVECDRAAASAFVAAGRPDKFFADLFALARRRLGAAGVTRVYGGGVSTHADPARFFSYRRDGVTGRMAALIWLEPGA